jgi:hypothetical protein
MVAVHPQFVVDAKSHKKAVIVPLRAWQRLMEDLAELEDIRSYDHAKAKGESAIPFETAVRQIRSRAKK